MSPFAHKGGNVNWIKKPQYANICIKTTKAEKMPFIAVSLSKYFLLTEEICEEKSVLYEKTVILYAVMTMGITMPKNRRKLTIPFKG